MRKRKFVCFAEKLITLFLVVCSFASPIFAQQKEPNDLVKKFEPHSLQEKLFVHIDRTFFLTGETMWFKIYLIDRTSNKLIDLSKIAYVELKDKDNATVLKAKIPLAGGIGNG